MSLFDGITTILIVFVLSVIVVIGYTIFDYAADTAPDPTNGDAARTLGLTSVWDIGKNIFAVFDYLIPFLMFALMIASILSAFVVRSHPAYSFAGFLFLLIAVLMSPTFTNMFFTLFDNAQVASVSDAFPNLIKIFQILPLISFFLMIIISVVMFNKSNVISQEGFG